MTVKCRPFYLPREFAVITMTIVYPPVQMLRKLGMFSTVPSVTCKILIQRMSSLWQGTLIKPT